MSFLTLKKTDTKQSFLLFTITLFLINFVSKAIYLSYYSFWLDEASSVSWSLRSAWGVVQFSLSYPNGPFYQLLLKYWIDLFGISEFSVRSLSLLFGSLTVFPLAILAKELFNKRTAVYAVLIYSLSNIYIYYFQEARSYTLVTFLVTFSFLYFYRIITKGRFKDVLLYVIFNTLLLYTHLTPIIIFFVQFVASLFFIKTSKKKVLYLYVSQAISVLLVMIWVLNNSWFGGNETNWLPIPGLLDILKLLGIYTNNKITLIIASLVVAFVLIKVLSHKNDIRFKNLSITLLWGLVPIAIIFLVSVYYNPRFIPRYMLYAVPGLYLSIAYAIDRATQNKFIQYTLGLIVVASMAANLNLRPEKSELWREAMEMHNQYRNEDSFTALSASYQEITFSYYFDKDIFKQFDKRKKLLKENEIYLYDNPKKLMRIMSENKHKKRLILVLSHNQFSDSKQDVLKYLDEHYMLISQKTNLKGIKVFVYDISKTAKTLRKTIAKNIKVKKQEYNSIWSADLAGFMEKGIYQLNLDFVADSIPENAKSTVVFEVLDKKANKFLYWKSIDLKKTKNHTFNIDASFKGKKLRIYAWQKAPYTSFNIKEFNVSYKVTVDYFIDEIKNDKRWMNIITEKANEKGCSVEEQVHNEANWIFSKKCQ